MSSIKFSVFTKPWKDSIDELGERVAGLGFDGIELPVRPGYPVTPETVKELPAAVKRLREHGVKVFSIAGPTDEETLAACAEAGIPIVRVMAPIRSEGYLATERALQLEFDGLLPLLEKYGVAIGVQNHTGRFVSNACGLRNLVGKFDPARIGIVWDAAHNALNGEEMELGIEIVWSHLLMVNLKNAFWKQTNGPEAESATFKPYWTNGSSGLASWPRVSKELQCRAYAGVVCLTAEYTEEHEVDRLIAKDLAYARSLFGCG
jgi:sugar phosphate isomerase/epimerase